MVRQAHHERKVNTLPDSFSFAARPFSMRTLWGLKEKVAEGRMRGGGAMKLQLFPLTLTLSLMERGLLYGFGLSGSVNKRGYKVLESNYSR